MNECFDLSTRLPTNTAMPDSSPEADKRVIGVAVAGGDRGVDAACDHPEHSEWLRTMGAWRVANFRRDSIRGRGTPLPLDWGEDTSSLGDMRPNRHAIQTRRPSQGSSLSIDRRNPLLKGYLSPVVCGVPRQIDDWRLPSSRRAGHVTLSGIAGFDSLSSIGSPSMPPGSNRPHRDRHG